MCRPRLVRLLSTLFIVSEYRGFSAQNLEKIKWSGFIFPVVFYWAVGQLLGLQFEVATVYSLFVIKYQCTMLVNCCEMSTKYNVSANLRSGCVKCRPLVFIW